MKLKDLFEAKTTNILDVDVELIDGSEIVSDIFTVQVEATIDDIDDAVAAPDEDVTKYKFTKNALARIHKEAYEYKVEIDESDIDDALKDGDLDGVIQIEIK